VPPALEFLGPDATSVWHYSRHLDPPRFRVSHLGAIRDVSVNQRSECPGQVSPRLATGAGPQVCTRGFGVGWRNEKKKHVSPVIDLPPTLVEGFNTRGQDSPFRVGAEAAQPWASDCAWTPPYGAHRAKTTASKLPSRTALAGRSDEKTKLLVRALSVVVNQFFVACAVLKAVRDRRQNRPYHTTIYISPRRLPRQNNAWATKLAWNLGAGNWICGLRGESALFLRGLATNNLAHVFRAFPRTHVPSRSPPGRFAVRRAVKPSDPARAFC